jgi:threonine dehydrogenase-like Zn-dependent dehydrogenase
MKALVWEGPRKMSLLDQPLPEPDADEVLVKVAYAGICGSELSGYLGHNALRVPPLIMGHEFAGRIETLGSEALKHNPSLRIGQQITVNPLISCGDCAYCRQGKTHLCAARQLIGAHRAGAYATYVRVPGRSAVPLPPGMSLRTGALTEPVAVAVRIAKLATLHTSDDVLIIGAGPIGLLTLQVLLLENVRRVFIVDLDGERLKMGKMLGGEPLHPARTDIVSAIREATLERGVRCAVDAVGTSQTRAQCIAATQSGGTVILTGLHEETSLMPAAEIIRREIIVQGSFAYSPADFAVALELLAHQKVRLDPWIIEAPLSDGGKWFDNLTDSTSSKQAAKILLIPEL